MMDCKNLVHPFQNDPGTSQRQRVMDELLSGDAKIDARTTADLLEFFVQFSRHINYYDRNLSISDWQPFFKKSLPFTISTIIKYEARSVNEKFDFYNSLFNKRPSAAGLQLTFYFIYYKTIWQINNWYLAVKDSGLPVENILRKLISENLAGPLSKFICLMKVACKWYCIKRMNVGALLDNEAWNLDMDDSSFDIENCFTEQVVDKTKRLIELQKALKELFPSFFEAIKTLSVTLETDESMQQALLPMKEELQKNHSPHLSLLFAFLKIFQKLQEDLNGYSRKHLDFFYTDVLKLKPKDAVPDKAHIIFELQNQLKKYALGKGLLLKDGKDDNKEEILFALDDEIVVNKTQVAEVRTLFLNNKVVHDKVYLEGIYMAPNAAKADGIDKDFKDPGPKNYPTLGAKNSKYIEPEKKEFKFYPNARVGFILASPVLLLNEGTRTVEITLPCEFKENCNLIGAEDDSNSDPCCDERENKRQADDKCHELPAFITMDKLYNRIKNVLKSSFYVITEDLITEAVKKGTSEAIAQKIRNIFLIDYCNINLCCSTQKKYKQQNSIKSKFWEIFLNNPNLSPGEIVILKEIFKEKTPLKILFSGEKEWLESSVTPIINITGNANSFMLQITATLKADKPAVTFYDKEKLKEDFNTKQPLVKIELDNDINPVLNKRLRKKLGLQKKEGNCCLDIVVPFCADRLSLYHFLRNYNVVEGTKIDVTVCGLKKFIVQNDEEVQDANGPFPAFGSRPEIIDFDAVNPADPPLPNRNLIGPNFYLGSNEIFFKKWGQLCIHLNWKDKPSNFNEYYKAYLKRNNFHDCTNILDNTKTVLGLNECDFLVQLSLLDKGCWKEESNSKLLFSKEVCTLYCTPENKYDYTFFVEPSDFSVTTNFIKFETNLRKFEVSTKYGFLRFNLRNQDFLHKDFPFVLGRQMMALGKYPDKGVEGAVYFGTGNSVIVFKDTGSKIVALESDINNIAIKANDANENVKHINENVTKARLPSTDDITDAEFNSTTLVPGNPKLADSIPAAVSNSNAAKGFADAAALKVIDIKQNLSIFDFITGGGKLSDDLSVPIPNPPWTPIIQNISLDYKASATMEEIDLIHLYPYTGTYKHVEIQLKPSLFPVFCHEGTLFMALKDLEPGSNVNVLFQFAEATADSESTKEIVSWQYLDNNQWKNLRKGFEVLDDATDGLTTSGVIKFALPANISTGNTIMPKHFYWIKASVSMNSSSVSELIGLHAQAIRATFTNSAANDKLRLSKPLLPGAISKLEVADANIKKVEQLYDSFDGIVPEEKGAGNYYVRVSELLSHKGRAIQKFDYERIALDAFPQLYKAKCISHSFALNAHQYFNDFPIAPGYVILAVIPDLNILKAGGSFEPKVPVSILDKIEAFLRLRTSPFVRLRAMNPRYEKINICLKIKLVLGYDENYYKEKLKEDLREFLAPWAIGEYSKLTFGQKVSRSDIIGLLESKRYVDYIIDFKMGLKTPDDIYEISPPTPRSILIAGEIEVCIAKKDCDEWGAGNCEQIIVIIDYSKENK